MEAASDIAQALHATTDAATWAARFMEVFGHRLTDVDEGTMLCWFANAIETGRAHVDVARLIQRVQDHATAGQISIDFNGDNWTVAVHEHLDDPDGYLDWTRTIASDNTYFTLEAALRGTLHYLETGSDDCDPEQAN